MRGLKDKVILICGSATGIGAQIVRRLAEEGARVAAADIDLDRVQALAQELDSSGDQVKAFWYDQGDADSIAAVVADTVAHFGQLDGLHANAANMQMVLVDGDVVQNPAEVWQQTLEVNVTGTALLFQAAIPHMEERGGVLLATSSDAAVSGEPTRVAYAASKAGVNAICRHVANRWGKQGIRSNVVSPGLILTENLQAGVDSNFLDSAMRRTPAARHGYPDDIASAVAFLFSDDAEWITGQVWHVNGGINQTN